MNIIRWINVYHGAIISAIEKFKEIHLWRVIWQEPYHAWKIRAHGVTYAYTGLIGVRLIC